MASNEVLQRSAVSLTNAKKLGSLQVEVSRKGYKKRWVILHGDLLYIFTDDGVSALQLLSQPQADKPKEVLALPEYSEAQTEGTNEFKLNKQDDKKVLYSFQAAGTPERDSWVEVINQARKVTTSEVKVKTLGKCKIWFWSCSP